MKIINRFVGEFFFLSNFYPSTLSFHGLIYPTAEHAYQAHKSEDLEIRKFISCAKNPMEAKKLGKCIPLKDDWGEKKVILMQEIIDEKFKNPILSEMLKATGNSLLIHENKFNDKFWGICAGKGENWLGKTLEDTRRKIIESEDLEFFG
jgi:ribA/ribD-fused uncharacterized protein